MHPRNIHRSGYDFDQLTEAMPTLAQFVHLSPRGRKTIDFADPAGVKMLNAALLKRYYNIDVWDIPEGYLCPPIPGRADYIHAIADLIPKHKLPQTITGLDIGTGANLIYPIIGTQVYNWRFVGSDTDKIALQSAKLIQSANSVLKGAVQIRHQTNKDNVFKGVVSHQDDFAFSMCNPPFHASPLAASAGSMRKNDNLRKNRNKRNPDVVFINKDKKVNQSLLNFAGQSNELWCEGGELGFIQGMVLESVKYQQQIKWFTSLVSKKESLAPIKRTIASVKATEVKVINMEQGSKMSRIIAWRFV
jgi:23S rRNA (adenine1618-N6)-methyltransferase